MKNLIKNWTLPNRDSEKVPVSLRLPFDVYAKLQALKELYPSVTVTDIATDVLREGLDQVIKALPDDDSMTLEAHNPSSQGIEDKLNTKKISPLKLFNLSYNRIVTEKTKEPELVVDESILSNLTIEACNCHQGVFDYVKQHENEYMNKDRWIPRAKILKELRISSIGTQNGSCKLQLEKRSIGKKGSPIYFRIKS